MAENAGQGYGQHAVNARSQAHNPKTDTWVKRNADSGGCVHNEASGGPFKGVRKDM